MRWLRVSVLLACCSFAAGVFVVDYSLNPAEIPGGVVVSKDGHPVLYIPGMSTLGEELAEDGSLEAWGGPWSWDGDSTLQRIDVGVWTEVTEGHCKPVELAPDVWVGAAAEEEGPNTNPAWLFHPSEQQRQVRERDLREKLEQPTLSEQLRAVAAVDCRPLEYYQKPKPYPSEMSSVRLSEALSSPGRAFTLMASALMAAIFVLTSLLLSKFLNRPFLAATAWIASVGGLFMPHAGVVSKVFEIQTVLGVGNEQFESAGHWAPDLISGAVVMLCVAVVFAAGPVWSCVLRKMVLSALDTD